MKMAGCKYAISWRSLALAVLVGALESALADQQPHIWSSKDGNLLLESAADKNITLRLSRGSTLLVNELNVLASLEEKLHPATIDKQEELPTVDAVSAHVKELKLELQRWSVRFSHLQNRTGDRSIVGSGIRRDLGRIRRVFQRIAQIEQQLSVNECEASPCKNGGTCYKSYKDFHCECIKGWAGKTCEEDIDECYLLAGTDLGCQNNAACVNTPGSYRCNCRNGYVGTHCRLRNATCESPQSAELCGHGICVHSNNEHGYTCVCDQGWSRSNDTPTCSIDVDECAEDSNPCHSNCINLPGSFKCGPCPSGYAGDGLSCLDINECAHNNGGCSLLPKVNCINSEGSFHCGNCPPGWVGDGHSCERAPSNSCDDEHICHPRAKCEYISGTAACSCPVGMYGHGFGANGCTGEESTDPCASHECKNNATCIVEGRGTRCICQRGFTGPLCDQADACHPSPCRNGGTCQLLPNNKFRCSCARGTTGTNCDILRATCGSVIRQEAGELSYPQDGSEYEANERCAWIIQTASNKVLNVTFGAFDLEEAPDCSKDWLQIHDGRTLVARMLGRFCGKALPFGGNVLSSHQQLFFWFRSDNATNGAGFKLSWTSQEHSCGATLELRAGDSNVIRSPGYPGKTPLNRDCEWNLNAPFGFRFLLHFYEVNLGTRPNCSGDTLKIFDSDLKLKFICDSTRPEPLYTASNKAVVQLHTDAFEADSSFQLHYEVVPGVPNCGGVYTEPQGVITGYMNAPVCLYLIRQPEGTKIELEFTQLASIANNDCDLLKLEVFDGKSDEDNLLKRLCGLRGTQEPLESTGNYMLIRYEYALVGLLLPTGFEAKYRRVCGDRFMGPQAGVFTTPNYPNAYYDHMTCTYYIYGPLDTVVHVNFSDFSMTESTPAQVDDRDEMDALRSDAAKLNYLDIHLSDTDMQRFYKGAPMHLVSQKNRIRIVFHSHVNSRRGRGLKVEYAFERKTCGGVLTEQKGYFQGGNLGMRLMPYCEWVFEAPEGKHVAMQLSYLHNDAKCSPGQTDLLIYANNTSNNDAELLHSYCGNEFRINEEFHSNVITISMKRSDPNQVGHTLYALFGNYSFVDSHSTCGGNFSARFGVIKSPNWPKPYAPLSDCTWIISAPIGHKIELVVRNFSLEYFRDTCADDLLEIRNGKNGDSPLIGSYCGSRIPARIPSFANYLRLHFVSDQFVSDEGFYITWRSTETGCGGRLTSHTGSIHSPHYPDVEAGAILCDWLISVAQGSTVDLTIANVGAHSDLCGNNMLTIYNGPSSSSRKLSFNCTRQTSTYQLHATTNQVLVRYAVEADEDGENADGLQFLLEYESSCNAVIDALQGVIETPNFPDEYPPNLNCAWDIRGGRNNKISLAFSHLSVEMTDAAHCNHDYVNVIDMLNDEVLSQKRLCTLPMEQVTSEGNRLLLKFVSDSTIGARGFRAEFQRRGCGEHLRAQAGILQTPNAPYSVDMDCDWYIEGQAGYQIVLNFMEVHIETQQYDCSADALIVSEWKNSSVSLLRECKVERMPLTVTSPANRLYIHFVTSATRSRKYFKANFNTKEASCGGSYRGNSGVITTPNYPYEFASGVECVWTISVESGHRIGFQLQDFNITESPDCRDAYVQVQAGDSVDESTAQRYCGQEPTYFKTVASNQITVTFQAKGNTMGKFALRYKRVCGGSFNDTSGFLKSRADENCEWEITAPEGSHITLDILNFDSQCSGGTVCVTRDGDLSFLKNDTTNNLTNCSNGLLTHGNQKIIDLCADHPTTLTTPTNKLRIAMSFVNFRAKYSSVQNACGGVLTSLRGSLASPYYPNSYPANVECIWELRAARGYHIELNFKALDIAQTEHCNGDYLEVRTAEQGRLLGLYCGKQVPTDSLSSFERLWIKFRSLDDSSGNGFELSWNWAHLNELNGSSGMIEAPPLYSIQSQAAYAWRIVVPRTQFVLMNFKEYSKGLNLYDGFDVVALRVEIPESPWTFVSSSNVLYLVSNNDELESYAISWSVLTNKTVAANETNSCQQTITLNSNDAVNISSPGYPHGYGTDLKCSWVIKPNDPASHVIFKLYEAKLEDVYDCSADYLRVSSSSNLQDWHEELRICKSADMTMMPINVLHGKPYIKLEFNTDVSVNGSGFTGKVLTMCGSNMTGSVGALLEMPVLSTIKSSKCEWHITARPGKRIAFSFDFGATEPKTEECQQYALIYDGIDEGAAVLQPGRICNQKGRNVKTLESSTNRVYVMYNVSGLLNQPFRRLWNLTYREIAECDDEVRLTHLVNWVNISSPNYPHVPHPHTECAWTVIGPAGETLQADFVDMFDMNRRSCDQEYVELFDGSTTLARSLGRYCKNPNSVRSTGNVLYVHYLTDISEPRNGFRVNISIGACGGTYAAFAGDIRSNNYPALGAYPAYTICEYTIKMPKNSRVRLTFEDLHLPFDAGNLNSSERIEIVGVTTVDRTEQPLVLYGNVTTMPKYESDENEVLIRFRSFRGNNNYRGFKLKYKRIYTLCYREVNDESGLLTVIKPEGGIFMAVCNWKITVPKGQRVRLQLLSLVSQLTNSSARILTSRSLTPKLIFYNDHDMSSKITELTPDDYNNSQVIRSSDNLMFVRLQLGYGALRITYVQARYSSDEESSCPPDISDSETGLVNINALQSHQSFFCRLRFTLSGEETITFKIKQLSVEWNSSVITQGMPYAMGFKNEEQFVPYTTFMSNVSDVFVSLSCRRGALRILQTEAMRITRLSANYRRHACGGTHNLDDGFSLDYPANIAAAADYGALECVWTLKNEVGSKSLKLLGNVSLTDSCEREYIEFYAGPTPLHAHIGRICRDSPFTGIDMQRQYTLMVYHVEDFKPRQSSFNLRAEHTILCGSNTKVMSSSAVTVDANTYRNNMECSWEFWTTDGLYLALSFVDRFFIEDSVNCSKDHIEVQRFEKGFWTPEARFCGREAPSMFDSNSRNLQVIFRTNNASTGDGFSFKVLSRCTATFNVTTQTQVINSPSSVDFRIRKMHCEYTLVTDSDKMINVRIRDKSPMYLRSDSSGNCRIASFTAFKQNPDSSSSEPTKYCLEGEVRAYKYLKLVYDTILPKVFTIEFELNSCGGNISMPTVLRPLRHESDNEVYADNMKCVWYVVAPADHSILIQFKYFELEESLNCQYDYVAVYAGTVLGEKELTKICGNKTADPPVVMVDGNHAVVAAISDDSSARRGFAAQLSFTRNCNERISLTDGNSPVTLTRHLAVNASEQLYCNYNVMAPVGYRVVVQLKVLQLNTAANCQSAAAACDSCNHVELLDSIGSKRSSMGKYCSNSGLPIKLISSFEDALLKLTAVQPGQYNFEIVLQMERSICGGLNELTLAEDQTIDIVWPDNKAEELYPPNAHCAWRITANREFYIMFKLLQLQNASQLTGQCLDYVHIKGPFSSKYFCGNATGIEMHLAKSGQVVADIIFHSDDEYEDKGFHIVAKSYIPCNRTYTQLNGHIQYIRSPQMSSACVDEIRVPKDYTLSLFISSTIFDDYNCNRTHLEVTDINTNTSLLSRCRSTYTETNLFSTTNAVRIHAEQFTFLDLNYVASKRTLPPGCGGEVYGLQGVITSPPYDNDRNHSECRWELTVPSPNKIRIIFNSFNMGSSINCNLDYVTFSEMQSNGTESNVKSFCGPDTPDSFVTRSNRVAIVSKKSPNFDGIGWAVTFDTDDYNYYLVY